MVLPYHKDPPTYDKDLPTYNKRSLPPDKTVLLHDKTILSYHKVFPTYKKTPLAGSKFKKWDSPVSYDCWKQDKRGLPKPWLPFLIARQQKL